MNEQHLKIKEICHVCRQIFFLLLTVCWAKLGCIWLLGFCALIVVAVPLHRGRRVNQVLQFFRFLVTFTVKSEQQQEGKALNDISKK